MFCLQKHDRVEANTSNYQLAHYRGSSPTKPAHSASLVGTDSVIRTIMNVPSATSSGVIILTRSLQSPVVELSQRGCKEESGEAHKHLINASCAIHVHANGSPDEPSAPSPDFCGLAPRLVPSSIYSLARYWSRPPHPPQRPALPLNTER
jgi:hypothetical protein